MRKERIIFEVDAHLKRAFMSILAQKGKTQREVLEKHVKSIVKRGK